MRWPLLIALSSCALWGAAVQPAVLNPTGPYFPARYTAEANEWSRALDLAPEARLLEALEEPSLFAGSTPTIRFLHYYELPRRGVCLRLTSTEVVRKTYGQDLSVKTTSHPVGPQMFEKACALIRRSSFQDGKSFLVGINSHGPQCLVEVRDQDGYRVGVGNVYPENGMQQLSTFLESL